MQYMQASSMVHYPWLGVPEIKVVVLLQVLAAMVKRPSQASHYRRAWNVAHVWTGRLSLILGIVLIFDGLLLYHSGQRKPPETSATVACMHMFIT